MATTRRQVLGPPVRPPAASVVERRVPVARVSARGRLLALVFVAGMASLAIEFCASRLLAPYFGTSLYVWGILIGLILIYLSIGYVLGGRLADRRPEPELLFRITAFAGLWTAFIPIAAYPVLLASERGFAQLSVGLVAGTLLAVVLLFAVPTILLGCVSPFAIRLLLKDVDSGGGTAGHVYALSTAGSILGTFLPVFWFIPGYGTRATLIGFGVALLALSMTGVRRHPALYAAILVLAAGAWAALAVGVKPPQQGRLLFETESAYNYIQVVQTGDRTELLLNEGEGVHSIYSPADVLTGGPWDYFLLGPAFRPAQAAEVPPRSVAILGLAGGTSARQLTAAYGTGVAITGVEIDPEIVAAGRRYFDMNEPNLKVDVQDARYWLQADTGRYDMIAVDAYQQPYIPFHLTTREFFLAVRSHLQPGGVMVIDIGRAGGDYRLVAALASTARSVFPSIFLADTERFTNTVLYASAERVSLDDVRHNLALAGEPLVQTVADAAETDGNLRASNYSAAPFTDDRAPVEELIDEMIWRYAFSR